MHMVFFVHYGKVTVTVNESEFRISAGGQWFVHRGEICICTTTKKPRNLLANILVCTGNYYSITNESKTNARIFFSQACEVPAQASGESPDDTQMG
jgi:centromere protein C